MILCFIRNFSTTEENYNDKLLMYNFLVQSWYYHDKTYSSWFPILLLMSFYYFALYILIYTVKFSQLWLPFISNDIYKESFLYSLLQLFIYSLITFICSPICFRLCALIHFTILMYLNPMYYLAFPDTWWFRYVFLYLYYQKDSSL